jgi:hypothetical protein
LVREVSGARDGAVEPFGVRAGLVTERCAAAGGSLAAGLAPDGAVPDGLVAADDFCGGRGSPFAIPRG